MNVIFKNFNKKEYNFLNLSKYGYGKGVKVATLESVGENSLYPYGIITNKESGSSHGKNTTLTCLEVAPQIELYSISNLNNNIDFVVSEGIKIVFASIGEISLSRRTLKKVRDNNIILIKSSGNVNSMQPTSATKSGDWITISSVGLSSRGDIYHSRFSEVHDYIDFASFGYVALPNLPKDPSFPKYFIGTSFSCPLVAGMVALILEDAKIKGFDLDQDSIYNILKDNSKMYGLKKNEIGNGVISLPDTIDYSDYVEDVIDMEFEDVKEGSWYYDAVEYVTNNGIMNGYNDGTFRPNDNIKRSEVAKIIYDIMNSEV